jgi:hypothetical protein
MSDGPEATAKKIKAFAIADEYLALLERTYHDDRDEGMALVVIALKFIVKYQADPERFLRWFSKTVKTQVSMALVPQAARAARPQ